jgi:hypothetical protein
MTISLMPLCGRHWFLMLNGSFLPVSEERAFSVPMKPAI